MTQSKDELPTYKVQRRRKHNPPAETIDTRPAEMAIIGFVLTFPARYFQAVNIKPAYFADETRGKVWEIVAEQIDRFGTGVTPANVIEQMVRKGLMGKNAATEFLVDCQDEARNCADPETAGSAWTAQIMEYAFRRQIKAAAADMHELSDAPVPMEELRGEVQEPIFSLLNFDSAAGPISTEAALDAELRRLDEQEAGTPLGMMTGIGPFDDLWNGAYPGAFVVVAARPSVGKTSLGMQLALRWSVDAELGGPAGIMAPPPAGGLFFSLEMDKQQILRRAACQLARLDLHNVGRKYFTGNELHRYKDALSKLKRSIDSGHLQLIDGNRMDGKILPKSVTDILAEIRYWRNRMDLKYVMVDYLQLVTGMRRKTDNREREVANISQLFKAAAQELKIPVICLAQLRRPNDDRAKKIPRMSEIRESGSIEQDADIIILIHNFDYVSDDKPEARRHREPCLLCLDKNRNGRTGRAACDFLPPSGVFLKREDSPSQFATDREDEPPAGW